MKDSPYLTHDLGARNDPKLLDLQMEMGGQGLGIYWCLVEMLWENDGKIPANYKSIAFALRWCKPAEVEKVVTGFGLFQVEGGMISSRSASARITHKKEQVEAKREGGRKGAERRWNGLPNSLPNSTPNAEPMLINKLINKQINKDYYSSLSSLPEDLEKEKQEIFDIFRKKDGSATDDELEQQLKSLVNWNNTHHIREGGWKNMGHDARMSAAEQWQLRGATGKKELSPEVVAAVEEFFRGGVAQETICRRFNNSEVRWAIRDEIKRQAKGGREQKGVDHG